MDIEEIKKYSKNKIEADDLTKQVRQRIKETAWEKQNQREGFTEAFQPLISQFEKPEDSKKENIFTQNQEMLRNQLALTEGLEANQKAITKGFKQIGRLADMKELSQIEPDDYGNYDPYYQYFLKEKQSEEKPKSSEKESKKILALNQEKFFNEEDLNYFEKLKFPRPNDFVKYVPSDLEFIYLDAREKKNDLGRIIGGLKKRKDQTEKVKILTAKNTKNHERLKKYMNRLKNYLVNLPYIEGDGIIKGSGNNLYFTPQELIKRFELLGGSLAAGNNGVLPEYIQIAHRLRDLGIVTNKQLNTLLRKII